MQIQTMFSRKTCNQVLNALLQNRKTTSLLTVFWKDTLSLCLDNDSIYYLCNLIVEPMGNLKTLKYIHMKKNVFLLCLLFIFGVGMASADVRLTHSINESWRFFKGDVSAAQSIDTSDADWETVDVPHTWNAADVLDDLPGYYRGIGWYRKSIFIPKERAHNRVTIFFEGANQETELFVNGKSAGMHIGGYTRFSFDITPLLRFGEQNTFAIKVNNSHNKDIPPLSADFTFFGGIYRDIYLIYTQQQHISTTHYASKGVYVTMPTVDASAAQVEIKTLLTNAESAAKRLLVEHTLVAPDGSIAAKVSAPVSVSGNAVSVENSLKFSVKQPQLWSPESPALYAVYSRIYDAKSKTMLDEIRQTIGFRWFEFSAENGFSLNGKPYKLIGTNRHQCFSLKGNALSDEFHVRDVLLLKAMGGNFLRVSHYPQDPVVMEMCDKLGIITSVEIPIVNAITESETFAANCLEMAKEMVLQDFNRPSVLIWSYMNEVLLRVPYNDRSEQRKPYLTAVKELAVRIENLIRATDPYRSTLIPFHGSADLYINAGLAHIPMIVGWNLYQGWYGGTFPDFDKFLDNVQERLKGIPFIITEYGADVDVRLHSFEPERFDYTADYADRYHEHYIKAIMSRPFVNGANIWNLNDFHSEPRTNAVPHINNKGIVSLDRELKNTYLHYKAMLGAGNVILIGDANWKVRGGTGDVNNTCIQPMNVYANTPTVEMFLNSVSLGKRPVVDNIARFEVPFVNGENVIEAVGMIDGKAIRDLQRVDFHMIPADLKSTELPFTDINVMLGSKRYFEDRKGGVVWLPEKEYTSGSWGYIGGRTFGAGTKHNQLPASDLDIWGTVDDPIFQTTRTGIEAFKLDVPDGEYTISFYWAELQGSISTKLAYNLGNDAQTEALDERIFDVAINGNKLINGLNIAKTYGKQRAVVLKFIVNVKNNEGINITFTPQKGETVLNAIRVYRNY